MGTVWPVKGLFLLLPLVAAGCGSSDADAPGPPHAPWEQAASGSTAEFLGAHSEIASSPPGAVAAPKATETRDRPVGVVPPHDPPADASATPSPTAGSSNFPPDPTPRAFSISLSPSDSKAPSSPQGYSKLLQAAQNSPFYQFGDGVYTWDDNRRIVVLAVPVNHPTLEEIREIGGHWNGTIEDTVGTRAWVQQCARRYADDALSAPDTVYGAVSAQAVHACLGGLTHLAELFASYWWTEAGIGCLSDAVTAHSLHGDNRPRPLTVCPSIGYDPAAPRMPGWLAERCHEIANANPHPRYPTDPAQSGEPLSSCWTPLLAIIESHAAENAEIGLPDSPHNCYHAFLGYVWARQTDRESRPPNDLAIGCHYRAFEAIP